MICVFFCVEYYCITTATGRNPFAVQLDDNNNNSIYYLCAESTATRPISDTAQRRYNNNNNNNNNNGQSQNSFQLECSNNSLLPI
jgi:hypothetical protein